MSPGSRKLVPATTLGRPVTRLLRALPKRDGWRLHAGASAMPSITCCSMQRAAGPVLASTLASGTPIPASCSRQCRRPVAAGRLAVDWNGDLRRTGQPSSNGFTRNSTAWPSIRSRRKDLATCLSTTTLSASASTTALAADRERSSRNTETAFRASQKSSGLGRSFFM